MKTLRNISALLLLSAGFAYGQNKDITVEGEQKLNTDFKKYRTFGWLDDQKSNFRLVEYTYEETADLSAVSNASMNNRSSSNDGKKNKTGRHHKKGKNRDEVTVYSYLFVVPSENQNVNNAVISKVEDEMEGRGYRKDATSPDLLIAYKVIDGATRIKGFSEGEPTRIEGNTEFRQPKDTVSYKVKPGTIMISLIDAKTSEVVWEGFASGVANNDDIINDEMKIKQAINLIFTKYEWRGDKYSMN